MTAGRVLSRVRKQHPARPEDFKKLGIVVKPIGAGAFRTVYRVKDTPLVVKFPLPGTDFVINKIHSRTELGRIKKFRRFGWMRKYLPKVYYHNSKTGVSIIEYVDDSKKLILRGVMSTSQQQRMQGMCDMVQELIYRLTGTKMTDITDDNVRFDQRRRVAKLIDLAY